MKNYYPSKLYGKKVQFMDRECINRLFLKYLVY